MDEKLLAIFWDLEKYLAWYDGRILEEVKFLRRDGGCLLVVTAQPSKGEPQVCFHWGRDRVEAFYQLAYNLTHQPGVSWRPSKF